MTRDPNFDELVGGEPSGPEREQLRRVHELLLRAGPPPELAPEVEAGPTLAMTLGRRPRQGRRRLALLAAAAIAVGVVFLGGYIVGNRNTSSPGAAARTIELQGTRAAPDALASLRVRPEDSSGNWPMTLDATGLPALPEGGRYAVYLVRGSDWEPCGWFSVAGPHTGVTVDLNAPYDLHSGDTWVVTRQAAGASGHGETVLRPTA
jgi:hypothetical protein